MRFNRIGHRPDFGDHAVFGRLTFFANSITSTMRSLGMTTVCRIIGQDKVPGPHGNTAELYVDA